MIAYACAALRVACVDAAQGWSQQLSRQHLNPSSGTYLLTSSPHLTAFPLLFIIINIFICCILSFKLSISQYTLALVYTYRPKMCKFCRLASSLLRPFSLPSPLPLPLSSFSLHQMEPCWTCDNRLLFLLAFSLFSKVFLLYLTLFP